MNEVQSKVKDVQGAGTWESQHGTLYSFEYNMEDGTVLKANHKSPDSALEAGSEVFYTVTKENNFGKQGKVSRTSSAAFNGGGGSQQSAARPAQSYSKPVANSADKNKAFALSYAKDIAVAHAASGVTGYGSNDQLIEELFLNADKMLAWLNK